MMERQAFSGPIRVVAGPEAASQYPAVFILDPSAAAGSAAINAEIGESSCSIEVNASSLPRVLVLYEVLCEAQPSRVRIPILG